MITCSPAMYTGETVLSFRRRVLQFTAAAGAGTSDLLGSSQLRILQLLHGLRSEYEH